jgi:hypothetical protein
LKQYAIENNYPLELTNENVMSNVWYRSNVVGETHINYLRYDKGKRKVYSIDTDNVVTHIAGVDFNALFPSAYSSIYNAMIGYTGKKMLMPGNFKEYRVDKEKIMSVINEKRELFVVMLKGGISEEKWDEFINYIPIIRNAEIYNNKSKKKQKKLTQLMTTMGLYMPFSSYYLWYIIDKF